MSGAVTTIDVQILDTGYRVSCPEGDVAALRESARDLDERMRGVRAGGKVRGLDRIAVMAALNMAHDNLRLRDRIDAAGRDVAKLTERIERALRADAAANAWSERALTAIDSA